MKQHYNETSIQHQFDAFCKKVLRNEAKSIRKRNTRTRKKEKPLNIINENKHPQINCNEQNIYFLFGMEILVSDQKLSAAIDQLPDIKRKIILLYYFAGFNDNEVGKFLNMSTSGVWYQREKAVEQLKVVYGIW